MSLFNKDLPRNAPRPIEQSGTIAFASGVGSLSLTTSSFEAYKITLTQNSALTITTPTDDQVINFRIAHTAGPWTLSLNGAALTLNAAAGEVEFLTCKYNGTEWECQQGVVVDVTA